jgi:protein-tyrosine phosphatase
MIDYVKSNAKNILNDYIERQVCEKYIDIHCHCLPGIDDGPATVPEAFMLCKTLAAEGISIAVATPHQLGRYEGRNRSADVREAVQSLNKMLRNRGIPIKIVPGGEVRVDERICRLIETDEILTLADGKKYILLELPHQVFIDIEPLLRELVSMGIQPVISHAERITALSKQPKLLHRWIKHSANLQITASSLLGIFGREDERAAWYFLTSGWVKFVATDSHDIYSRKPQMRAAFKRIKMRLGEDIANTVCFENPLRVINGKEIISISNRVQQEMEL